MQTHGSARENSAEGKRIASVEWSASRSAWHTSSVRIRCRATYDLGVQQYPTFADPLFRRVFALFTRRGHEYCHFLRAARRKHVLYILASCFSSTLFARRKAYPPANDEFWDVYVPSLSQIEAYTEILCSGEIGPVTTGSRVLTNAHTLT